jgi:hypothetical protein
MDEPPNGGLCPGHSRWRVDPIVLRRNRRYRAAASVYALGYDSFRLDFHSANNVVDRIVDALG